MAYRAEIDLSVNNREALKGVTQVEGGINKLIKGVKEFERVFNEALSPKGAIQSRFQLEQERKALALFKQQNAALQNQVRLAAQLGSAYDKLQVKVVGTELRRLERARTSQRALPGGRSIDQKRLPAAGQTSGTQFSGDITAAVRAEARVREAVLAEAERQLAADKRATAAKERIARAAQGEVSATTRTPGAPQPFGLLEPARGQRITSAPVGSSGGSRYQQRLQAEVDRQIRVTGKLSNEILETVAKYNKVQSSADRLVKTQGRLSTELSNAAKTGGGSGARSGGGSGARSGGGSGARSGGGSGGAGGGLAAGIGFPLLFGSGPGSVIGGAIGSAGGFGTQILASAIGGIIDQAIADVAKLGQAFTKTGVDADALANAIGDLSGSTKKLIEETKDVSGSQAAAEAAAKLMAASIGEDAVDALVKLGDATNDLSSAAAILNTEFAALAAELLGPVAAGIAGLLERTNLINAAARFRKEGGVNADRIGAAGERGFKEGGQQGAIDAQIEEAGKIVIEQRREAAKFITDANIENSKTLEILVAEGQILDINKNLLDSKTLQITKGNIALKYAAELEKEGLTPLEKKVIEQKKLNELKVIDNKVTEQQQAANRKAEADAKKAQQEAQRAQRELEARNRGISSAQVGSMQALIAGSSAGLQSTRVFEGEKAFLDESEKALEYEVRLKTRILDIQYKQQASQAKSQEEAEHLFNTYNTQYGTIERIYFTQLQQVRQQKEQLRVQKEINALQQAEETAGITRGFTRNIADVERRIASPFGGDDSDMLNLRIEQLRRTEDIYRDIDTQVSILNKQLEADPSNEIIADNIKGLEERRQKLEALLPVLDQVEQAELRQNQLMEKYGFIANEAATAMSSAVQSIVTGTGSVQEAFSNMFANIGKAFIDMATQMIAKALIMKAIGILTSAFGGGGGGGGFNPNAPSITGNSLGDFGGGSFGGFMANGGPVSANTPYIVGERGPELMVPSTSGMVLSNSETRQQLTQQDSAMRSTEATRQQLNTQRNTMITNSTRETERMTEMMLSNPDPIDVRYESTVINNVEYVTAEQHRQGMAQAAERGRSLTLSALQGSVKTRKKVGLS